MSILKDILSIFTLSRAKDECKILTELKAADGTVLTRNDTALKAVQGIDLTGKVFVLTGGSSGIGAETVRTLASAGAKVIFTCRNLKAADKVLDEVRAAGKGQAVAKQLDLADLENIHKFARELLSEEKRVDVLILNAGMYQTAKTLTKQGFETTIGVNHFGHFALVQDLLEFMKKQ